MSLNFDHPGFQSTVVVTLAVTLFSAYVSQNPYFTSRQEQNRQTPIARSWDNRVESRLWQDPLEAAEKDYQARLSRSPRFVDEVWDGLKENTSPNSSPDRTLVVLAMFPGGNYVEDHERRLRDRYAINAALEVACFTPHHTDSIGYFSYYSLSENILDGLGIIPYEWFRTRTSKDCYSSDNSSAASRHFQRVLVLYLKDDAFAKAPIKKLNALGSVLKKGYQKATEKKATENDIDHDLTFTILGPHSSDGFRSLLKAAKEGEVNHAEPFIKFTLFSPWSSVASQFLLWYSDKDDSSLNTRDAFDNKIHTRLKDVSIDLQFRLNTDDDVLEALIEELRLRSVKAGTDPVVLLSESDTMYGRTLPLTFAAVTKAKKDGKPLGHDQLELAKSLRAVKENPVDMMRELKIWHYTYLRGLDGMIPGEHIPGPKGDTKRGNGPMASLEEEQGRLERSENDSQFDYIRRLIARIKQEVGLRPRAIGLLGTDIYDEILLLQALHREFPTTLFFATDMDGRLLEPRYNKFTRNLLVGSQFGLALRKEIQQTVSPFRDNYQTSTFFSTLRAVGHIQHDSKSNSYTVDLPKNKFNTVIEPRVFEIGHTQAVDLSLHTVPGSIHPQPQPFLPCLPKPILVEHLFGLTWPDCRDLRESFFASLLALCLPLSLVIWLLHRFTNVVTTFTDFVKDCRKNAPCLFYGASAISGLFLFLALLIWFIQVLKAQEAEPFFLLEGVSVWVSELIRIVVALYSLYAIAYSVRLLRLEGKELSESLKMGMPPESDPPPAGQQPKNFLEIWTLHLQDGLWEKRLSRIAPDFLIALVPFGILILWYGLPIAPVRNDFTFWFDRGVFILTAMILIFHVCFVLDALRLASKLLDPLEANMESPDFWGGLLEHVEKWKLFDPSPSKISAPDSYPSSDAIRMTARVIGDWTGTVNKIIIYPFIALFLMILARIRIFDAWDFPDWIQFMWAFLALFTAVLAWHLSHKARAIRNGLVEKLDKMLLTERSKDCADYVKTVRDYVVGLKHGAYEPFYLQPSFNALILTAFGFLEWYWLNP